jgi:hypothetical protein
MRFIFTQTYPLLLKYQAFTILQYVEANLIRYVIH